MSKEFDRAFWEIDGQPVKEEVYTRWFKSKAAEDELPVPLPEGNC